MIEYGYQKAPKEIFQLKNLPQLPKEIQMKIKRSDTMFSLIFSVIFGVIFLMVLVDYHEYIGFYNQGVMTSPFFNLSFTEPFIPILAASIIISVIVHLIKLFDGQWTRRALIAHTIYELISITIVITFLNASKLIDPSFIQDMATLTEYSTAQVLNAFDLGFKAILSLITLIMVLQFGFLYYRYWKKRSK